MKPRPDPQVTRLLDRVSSGDESARGELMEVVYDELRRVARSVYRPGGGADVLQPTALVHEAWLKLGDDRSWDGRRHFFAVAAMAMRQVLANHARDARREKRGGDWKRVTLDAETGDDLREKTIDLIALDEALERLGRVNEEHARLFDLRYLAGMSTAEIAELWGKSERSIQMAWRATRAFLTRELAG